MQKVVLEVGLFDERCKQKAMKAVSGLEGLESIEMNMKEKKLTMIGDIDPVLVVRKLRRYCNTRILTVGPAKEEKKKPEEPKKPEVPKKPEEPKKPEPKKPDVVCPKKPDICPKEPCIVPQPCVMPYYPQFQPVPYYYKHVPCEDPNGCVIC